MKNKDLAGQIALIAIAVRAEAHRKNETKLLILADLLDWIALELTR